MRRGERYTSGCANGTVGVSVVDTIRGVWLDSRPRRGGRKFHGSSYQGLQKMSGTEINKLILAGLTTVLVMLMIGNVVNELSHREPLERNAYAVVASDEPAPSKPGSASPAEATPGLEPVTLLLASADPAAGQKASKRCASCHTFNDGGANRVGPNLWGIVGRDKGSVDGFKYSDALRDKGGAWSYDDLNAFLANPKDFIKGTRMSFAGVKKVQDRAAIIAYMRQQSASPLPLPAQ